MKTTTCHCCGREGQDHVQARLRMTVPKGFAGGGEVVEARDSVPLCSRCARGGAPTPNAPPVSSPQEQAGCGRANTTGSLPVSIAYIIMEKPS